MVLSASATRRPGTAIKLADSANAIARRRISCHSASVCGCFSCTPVEFEIVDTDSQMKSLDGSTTESMISWKVAVGWYGLAFVIAASVLLAGLAERGKLELPWHAANAQ